MLLTSLVLLICIFQMMMGVIRGENIPCKIMSFCCLSNYVVVLLCCWSLFSGKESFIDIAYIYVLFGFVMNLAFTKLNQASFQNNPLTRHPRQAAQQRYRGSKEVLQDSKFSVFSSEETQNVALKGKNND